MVWSFPCSKHSLIDNLEPDQTMSFLLIPYNSGAQIGD